MRTGQYSKVGVAALAIALATAPTAHARDIADSGQMRRDGVSGAAGRYAETLADYNAWIRRRPLEAAPYQARGRLNLLLGQAGAAAADLEKAVRLKPTDAYNVLWLHFARNKESAPDIIELQTNAARVNRAVWPGPLLDYLTGTIDASAALAKAGDGQGKAAQLCEADLFLGQDHLAKGRRSEGEERLQAAENDCEGGVREAMLAHPNLAGLVTPKPAPTPVSTTPPKAPSMVADPALRPAWVRPGPQVQIQAKPQIQANPQTLTADPLLLRGGLR